jgi:hypothetical protein
MLGIPHAANSTASPLTSSCTPGFLMCQ